MAKDSIAMRGSNNVVPRRSFAKHRDQVPLAVEHRHHPGKGDRTARTASFYFQGNQVVWGDAQGMHGCPAAIEQASEEIGMATAVKPAFE
jgi:hypothetical protein